MSSTAPKADWHWAYEPSPSLCRHYLPIFGDHKLSNVCQCKPLLQNEPTYTVVIHNA